MGGKRGRGLLGAVIGVVAAVALPFAAPAIAGALFGSTTLGALTAAGALYGAATGALAGSLTGNAGRGALLGGLGGAAGGFIQGGGIGATQNALFGTTEAASTAAPGVSGATTAPAQTLGDLGVYADPNALAAPTGIGNGPVLTEPSFTQRFMAGFNGQPVGGPGTATAGGGTGIGGAAGTATGGADVAANVAGVAPKPPAPSFFSAEGLGRATGNLASGLTTPSGILGVGQLAMTMYNRPPEGLTAQEQAYVNETAGLAQTNRALFDQRVNAARSLLQQGAANPEQAFAQASMGTQRRFAQAGLRSEGDIRRGEIAGGQAGAAAVPAEFGRSYAALTAGLNATPTTAPAGAASMTLPAYRDAERRQREYDRDLASGVGSLASALGGRSSQKSIFA